MKKYRVKVKEHLFESDFGGIQPWFEVHIQMRVLWFFWVDVREPIMSDYCEYAENCANEIIEYLEKDC